MILLDVSPSHGISPFSRYINVDRGYLHVYPRIDRLQGRCVDKVLDSSSGTFKVANEISYADYGKSTVAVVSLCLPTMFSQQGS